MCIYNFYISVAKDINAAFAAVFAKLILDVDNLIVCCMIVTITNYLCWR